MPGASRLDCRNQRHPAFFMSVWADPECRASDDTNGSNKKLPRIIELNAEYAMLLERKKSSYLLSIISELSTIENLKSILSICKHHMPRWETDEAFFSRIRRYGV